MNDQRRGGGTPLTAAISEEDRGGLKKTDAGKTT